MEVNPNFRPLLKPRVIVITSAITSLIYQLFYYLHPANQGWWQEDYFSIFNALRFLFIDQIFLECFSVFITFLLVSLYASIVRIDLSSSHPKTVVTGIFKLLPAILLVFFIFNPITQTLRFLLNHLSDQNWSIYWESYWYNIKLYLTYMPVVFAWVVGGLIYLISIQSKETPQRKKVYARHLKAMTGQGEKLIDIATIRYIERKERKCFIHADGVSTNSKSLSELEAILPADFIRINRAVIARISEIENYAYWENDKYVMHLKGGEEFVVSRQRMNTIKESLLVT